MPTLTPPTTQRRVIAVAGNPNSGKTTLFNRLTGLRHKVANYAGVTVERHSGVFLSGATEVELIDLPGTYSLSPRSEEERVAAEVVLGLHPDVPPVDGVLCVLDSTCLEKSLYLVMQVLETGIPAVVLLNMHDELELRGARIDAVTLSRRLDVPVLAISATQGTGLEELKNLINTWNWGVKAPNTPSKQLPIVPTSAQIVTRRMQVKQIVKEVLKKDVGPHPWSDKLDAVIMHRVWGPLIFGLVVLTVFQSIFSWAAPLMNGINALFQHGALLVQNHTAPGLFRSFINDGIISGVGSVIVFLPQILIVFFFIAILEHSGYLARAALVMDRFMNKVGLQGKSFLPLISSYACAVPGIMATRTIENKRDRLATILVAPFMTCSARLPVYAFLIAAFVPDRPVLGSFFRLPALTLLGLYIVGFLAAVITAAVLKSSILKADKTPFFLEIPPYRIPTFKTVGLVMFDRAKIFLQNAGTVIMLTTLVLWALASFPRTLEGLPQIENSYAAKIGKAIEPAIAPLGFNWKIGVGLLSAQAAREVMVSSLATIYNIESEDTTNLREAVKADLTPLGAISLMVFFALAMQCMSTLAVVKRETGGWKMPLGMFVYMNGVAYTASLAVFQLGRLAGFY